MLQREQYLETVREAGLSDVAILKDVDFLAAIGDTLPEEINIMAS